MISQLNMWNKIGRIVMRLSERLDVSMLQAFDILYTSKTCQDLHDPEQDLYLYSDEYITDNIINEFRYQ